MIETNPTLDHQPDCGLKHGFLLLARRKPLTGFEPPEIHVLRKDQALFEDRHTAIVVACRLHDRARVSRKHVNAQHNDAVAGLEMQVYNLALAGEVTEGRVEFSGFKCDVSLWSRLVRSSK